MCKESSPSEYDQIFFKNLFASRGKANYLQFLLVINLAVYAGLRTIGNGTIFSTAPTTTYLLLITLLFLINFAVTQIYLREHNSDERITHYFKESLVYQSGKLSKELYDKYRDFFNQEMKAGDYRKTWKITKVIFSALLGIPITLLGFSLLSEACDWKIANIKTPFATYVIALISFSCLSFVFYRLFAHWEENIRTHKMLLP